MFTINIVRALRTCSLQTAVSQNRIGLDVYDNGDLIKDVLLV